MVEHVESSQIGLGSGDTGYLMSESFNRDVMYIIYRYVSDSIS